MKNGGKKNEDKIKLLFTESLNLSNHQVELGLFLTLGYQKELFII